MPTPALVHYGLTYPQCGVAKETALDILKALDHVKCVVVSRETHEDGNHHLHAYVRFEKRLRRAPETFMLGTFRPNIQPVNNVRGWIKYLTKEDKMPFTYQFDWKACLKKKSPRVTTAALADCSIEQIAKKVAPKDFQRTIAGLQLFKALTTEQEDLPGPCGYWIAGFAGTGKSTDARRFADAIHEKVFIKQRNKWWDGYTDQQVVIMDDPHVGDKNWLTPYLKIWADAYVFSAETKGGTMQIRPKFIIVTANYSLDAFVEHEEDREALRRRFKQSPWINSFGEALHWLILETIGTPHLPEETAD